MTPADPAVEPRPTSPPMGEGEAAFWVFLEVCNECRLPATDGQRLIGISRASWYNWMNGKNKPFATHAVRIRRATKHLRANLAEKILPALTGAKRRSVVAEIIQQLNGEGGSGREFVSG